jgi:ribosomal protein S18 acetylase RimI-like enzyme
MLTIRKGKPSDTPALTELVMILLREMDLPLIDELGETAFMALLEQVILGKDTVYACERALVATTREGEVVGAAFGYTNDEEAALDANFQRFLDQHTSAQEPLFRDTEIFGDEWYLDAIAVFERYRGQGIGTALLQALPLLAQEAHKEVIGLNVDFTNPKAQQLYAKIGFTPAGTMTFAGHHYVHMYWHYRESST